MSRRIPRLNQLIKKELSQLLLREVDFPKDVLVTVTRVDTSPDLSQAKVYISTLPEEMAEIPLKILENRIYELQQKINQRLKMKFIPRIKFVKETEVSQAAKIEEILEKIKKENQ